MADQTSGEQPRRQRRDEQLSREELEFRRHWRLLIDRLGGQHKAAKAMYWSKQTVSRDWHGITQPYRLQELCNHLKLEGDERRELEVLLRRARDAQQARRNGDSALQKEPEEARAPRPEAFSPELAQEPEGRYLYRRRVIAVATAAVVVVATVTVGVLVLSPGKSPRAATPTVSADVQGNYRGQGVKAVSIPVGSLAPSLRAQFHQGKTKLAKVVTGYEFRSALNPLLCLSAVDTGSLAGQRRDPVEIAACKLKLTANQIWIPVQWDINGQSYTHLVSDKYQTMCLNADKINGTTGPGNAIMLWDCYYPAGNEAWTFGAWYKSVAPGRQSYRLCLSNSVHHCIDADRRPDVAAPVRLWTQQATAGQFWS